MNNITVIFEPINNFNIISQIYPFRSIVYSSLPEPLPHVRAPNRYQYHNFDPIRLSFPHLFSLSNSVTTVSSCTKCSSRPLPTAVAAMSLKNPYGLTLELGAAQALAQCETYDSHEFDTNSLRAFSGQHEPPPFDLPIDDRCLIEDSVEQDDATAAAAASVRMRIRDSAVLRSEQVAGFANTTCNNFQVVEDEPEEPELNETSSEEIRLNFFVHNGYRYDGDVFELRPPQERSIASRPERVLPHKPAVLNHRQVFNRVYSEGTYNNRPSSLRQLRLSARLSAASWASVSDMLAASDEPPVANHIVPNTNRGSARVSLLVENSLVTEEQAKLIKVASPNAPPVQRTPRLTRHINKENEPESTSGKSSRKIHPAPNAEKRSNTGRRKKSRHNNNNVDNDQDRLARVATMTGPDNSQSSSRSVLVPKNSATHTSTSSSSVLLRTEQPGPPAKPRTKKVHKSPAKKKPFWKSLVHM